MRVKPAFRSDRAGCARSIHCSRDVVCCRNEKIGLLQIRRPQNPSVFRHFENGLGRHPFHKTFVPQNVQEVLQFTYLYNNLSGMLGFSRKTDV